MAAVHLRKGRIHASKYRVFGDTGFRMETLIKHITEVESEYQVKRR